MVKENKKPDDDDDDTDDADYDDDDDTDYYKLSAAGEPVNAADRGQLPEKAGGADGQDLNTHRHHLPSLSYTKGDDDDDW